MLTVIPSVLLKRALLAGALVPNAWGLAFVLMQAIAVALLAGLQWAGLRRSAPATVGLAAPGMAGSGYRS